MSWDTSMTRLVWAGPRSLTRQLVVAPVLTRITVMTVPNGSVRWAQDLSAAWYQDA